MTQRLPIPGSDDGTWGDILNSYLAVSHNTDGTLANNTVGTSQLQNNAVTNAQLDSSTQSQLSAAASAVQSVNSKTGASVTLAANDVGAVDKTGDTMTGTLTLPSLKVTGGSVGAGQVLTSDSAGNATWQAPPSGGGSGPQTVIVPFDFQTNGNQYFTSPIIVTFSAQSALNGTGSTEATVSYALNGAAHNLPIAMAAGDELTVQVSGLTGSDRVSFSLEGTT
jgi:hypothetical protein